MLPTHTAVRILDDDHDRNGQTGFVYRRAGEESTSGETIGLRRMEVAFDDGTPSNPETAVFHEDDLEIVGC